MLDQSVRRSEGGMYTGLWLIDTMPKNGWACELVEDLGDAICRLPNVRGGDRSLCPSPATPEARQRS